MTFINNILAWNMFNFKRLPLILVLSFLSLSTSNAQIELKISTNKNTIHPGDDLVISATLTNRSSGNQILKAFSEPYIFQQLIICKKKAGDVETRLLTTASREFAYPLDLTKIKPKQSVKLPIKGELKALNSKNAKGLPISEYFIDLGTCSYVIKQSGVYYISFKIPKLEKEELVAYQKLGFSNIYNTDLQSNSIPITIDLSKLK